jgi:hypothetical protein
MNKMSDESRLTDEARQAAKAFLWVDCRTCQNYKMNFWPGKCVATLRCVDGSSFKRSPPVQLWEESPAVDTSW